MPTPVIRLIATDLDGTLIGGDADLARFTEFNQRLDLLRERFGAQWVVCTGRSLHSFENVLGPMRAMGLSPEHAVIRHAYLYGIGRGGYWPHFIWNLGIRFQIWSGSLYLRGAIREWHRMVRRMSDKVTTVYHRHNRLCLRFRTDEEAEAAAELLRQKASVFKHLRVFLYMLEVDVRTVPFTKGMAIGELADRLGVKPSEILAIGNGHNDISMLDGTVAAFTGCPANAEVDVMDTVHRSGGHVATARGIAGVIEVMDAYLGDAVNSELPEWWVPTRQQKNPRSAGRRMNHPRHRKNSPANTSGMAMRLGILAGYTILLVFASFGLIPFSGLIIKPFTLVARLIEWLISHLHV